MNKKIIMPSIIGIILVLLLSSSIYFYRQYKSTKKMLDNPNSQTKDEKEKLIKEVGALIYLPREDPIIATVTDKKKLESQPFFAKAENGDRILLYQKNREAILYRPSINKIIEVNQINLEASSSASAVTPTKIVELPSPTVAPTIVNKVKLAIYNGTKVKGLAGKKKDIILASMDNIDVVTTNNSINDYTENLIINLNKVNDSIIQQLNKLVSAKVVTLPKGETAPADADLLLIIGKE
jgi:hypothetical protein